MPAQNSVFDIHIKGGIVVDGTRAPRFRADVWIKDDRIAQIGGRNSGEARKVIDATGHIVAPGFVDLHTHYDGQIRWDPWCSISGWHGVTSVALGNCGFGFAPCKPEFRERSMLTMTRTEAIPFATLKAGFLPHWDWETIPEYLDSLDKAPKGVNCLHYMPTASLMTYVMGLEAAKTRSANAAEREEMQRLLHEGMDAGLCGFSIQRLGKDSTQADFDGTPMVTDTMCDEDIFNLAQVLKERDEGFIQITQLTMDRDHDRRFSEQLAEVAGRPIIWNAVAPARRDPRPHQEPLAWMDKCWERGLQMFAQCVVGRAGFSFTLEHWNLYDASPAWRDVTLGTKKEKLAKMADPKRRAALIAEFEEADKRLRAVQAGVGGAVENLIIQAVNNQPEMEEYLGKSVGMIAQEQNKHPIDVMLDLSIQGDLNVEFLGPERGANPQFMAEMLARPYALPGISDGGAHTKFFTGGAWPTDMLRWLVRDEKVLSLEEAHYRMSALSAHAAGFRDRGVLREGAAADVLVYDLQTLDVDPHWIGDVAYDLPGGEWRRIQRPKGYRSIIVNGQETFIDGKCTGATPGHLLRHGRG